MANVRVDGIEYAPVATSGMQKMIIIVDTSGLTFVGDVDLSSDDQWITIYDAQCVIQWGTTEHLAELAEGPTKNTKLGKKRDVIVSRARIIAAYRCGDGW